MISPNEAITNIAYEKGKQYEMKNGDCAQCTLAAVFEALGIKDDAVFKSATSLADGLGLTGNGHCGALSGGAMAIGYLYGRDIEKFANMKKTIRANIITKKLHDRFLEKYGAIRCMDIQKKLAGRFYDMYNPEDFERAMKDNFFNISSSVVGEVSRMVVQLILDERERSQEKK